MISDYKQTKPLNDYETKQLVPLVARGIANHIGKSRAVPASTIVAALRKIVNYLRTSCIIPCLCSCSSGYYVAANQQELDSCIGDILSRERANHEVRAALEKQRSKYFQQQTII